MSRKLWTVVAIAVALIVALTIGLVAARAQSSAKLAKLSAAELLNKMAQAGHNGGVNRISGDVSWTNDLFGSAGVQLSNQGPAQSPLLASGSGRVWAQDGDLRFESQGSGGDQITVIDSGRHLAWTFDSSVNTVTKYRLPAGSAAGGEPASPATAHPLPSTTATFGPAQIERGIQQMAPYAAVSITGTERVAGRAAYILQLTPTAKDTAFGSLRVAVDGETYVPLRVQAYAVGSGKPAFAFGFTRVSFGRIDAGLFSFTPPAGGKVTVQDLAKQAGANDKGAGSTGATRAGSGGQPGAAGHGKEVKPLTLTQARAEAGFTLLAPPASYDATRPFAGAQVVTQALLAQLTSVAGPGAGAPSAASTSHTGAPQHGALLVYGKGFGTIVLVETPATPSLDKQLAKLPSLFKGGSVAGQQAHTITTALGSVIVWKQSGLVLAAAGMVPSADLSTFVSLVR
jgi:outer membrane lipoprotein-sorting protein